MQTADTDRDAWLGRGQFAYSKAAYALARIGDLRGAVVVLEQARARSLSQLLAEADGESARESTWNDIAIRLFISSRRSSAVVREDVLDEIDHQVHVLGLFPLHAAWTESDGRKVYALDTVAFGYTPSARLLTHTRRVAQLVPAERAELLAVSDPLSDAAPLPKADIEVQGIASLFPSPQVLRHEQATRERIMKKLRHAQVAHFACHAETNWLDPLESGLRLASDSWLTVRDLSEMQLGAARLAVLSACETGIIGLRLPDEVVSLPSALLKVGFAGVLASMWEVKDQSTALLMQRFYALWRTKGMAPVQALREAQRRLRKATTRDMSMFSIQRFPAPFRQVFATFITMSFIACRLVNAILRRRTEHPFEHPYSWAAFYFTGV